MARFGLCTGSLWTVHWLALDYAPPSRWNPDPGAASPAQCGAMHPSDDPQFIGNSSFAGWKTQVNHEIDIEVGHAQGCLAGLDMKLVLLASHNADCVCGNTC